MQRTCLLTLTTVVAVMQFALILVFRFPVLVSIWASSVHHVRTMALSYEPNASILCSGEFYARALPLAIVDIPASFLHRLSMEPLK